MNEDIVFDYIVLYQELIFLRTYKYTNHIKIMKVEKRDGTIQPFRFEKIERAVEKVFSSKSVNKEMPENFIEQLKAHFDDIIAKKDEDYAMPIEDIQDIIRNFLIKKNKYDAAEAFILYRDKREQIRNEKSWFTKEIKKKLNGSAIENQNANVDEGSFSGRMGEATRVVTKDLALKNVSRKSANNHNNNLIYIHDLDSYEVGMHNCLSIPYDDLLRTGFNTRQTDVRGANSINTAFQLTAVIFQLQSLQQFGGVAATHIDWTMVPYVRKSFFKHFKKGLRYICGMDQDQIKNVVWHINPEKMSIEDALYTDKQFAKVYTYALDMTKAELDQAVEGMYHNLNTLQSRSGGQLPFTSINYGTCTLPEGRMVIKSLIEGSIKGTGKFGRTSIFPCGIFQYKKGVNDKPGTPNYDMYRMALDSTTKRLYPNYANCDWSTQVSQVKKDREIKQSILDSLSNNEMTKLTEILMNNEELANKLSIKIKQGKCVIDQEEQPFEMFTTMGCRTVNGLDINFKDCYIANIKSVIETGEMKYADVLSAAQKDGRGNICPVTIILPTLAMLAKEAAKTKGTDQIEEFMTMLDDKIAEARDMLIERFKHIASQSSGSAKFMYENHTMAGYNKEEGIVSAVKHGTIVIGQLGMSETLYLLLGCDQTKPEGMELAKRIEELYLKRTNEFKEQYHLNFGNYYTPAESLCYTAFKKWYNTYGDYENVTYYIDANGDRQEKLYFTNSIHVPVYVEMTPFEKIDIESQLTGYSNAGCITYIEMKHDVIHNIDALEEIVNYAMDHDIPYFAVNVPSDQCESCGYQGHIGDKCPKCGSTKISRLRRVTGYLTGDYNSAFNNGKIRETDQRVKHNKEIDV